MNEPEPTLEMLMAARNFYEAVVALRAVPRDPEIHRTRKVYQDRYDECVADMRKMLENAGADE